MVRPRLVLLLRSVVWIVGVVLLLAAIFWAWLYLHNPQSFPIRRVVVAGQYTHADPASIQTLVSPLVQQGLFSADLTQIRAQLEALPWIQTAIVTRVWPDQLKITLVEKTPLALMPNGGVITDKGVIFYPLKKTVPVGLPVFDGDPREGERMVQAYQDFLHILAPLDLHISELCLTSTGMWSIRLSNGTEVIIGSQEVLPRLKRFKQVYHRIFDHRVARSVDLRYAHGLAVQWQQ